MVLAGGGGEAGIGITANGYENVLELDSGDGCIILWKY